MIKQIVKDRIDDVFAKIEANNSLMDIPKENLRRFKESKTLHPKYVSMWEDILKKPLSEIKELLLEDSEFGEILRGTSIFIRIL